MILNEYRDVDRICEEFEQEWKTGKRPNLITYLKNATPQLRSELFAELLAVDLEQRIGQGERPQLKEYREKFVEGHNAIERRWAIRLRRNSVTPRRRGLASHRRK